MKQFKIVKAYQATENMSKCEKLDAETLWSIYQLRKKLYPHVEFQAEREDALREKYAEFADEDGVIKGEPYTNYVKDLSEIATMDKEVNIPDKITIKLQDEMGITVQMMEALDEFVNFVKE